MSTGDDYDDRYLNDDKQAKIYIVQKGQFAFQSLNRKM